MTFVAGLVNLWAMPDRNLRHAWLRALGPSELPAQITLADGVYAHVRTYKHDFFAATGLYEGPSGKAVLKVGRTAGLFGFPMQWVGRYLAGHERDIYERVDGLPGVPRCLGRWGPTGFVHAFVPGHPLQRHEGVDDDFFPALQSLIDAIHARGIAYVDLEKRENILVGDDGRPYLIDFQISWHWPNLRPPRGTAAPSVSTGWKPVPHSVSPLQRLVPDELGRYILRVLQRGDRYHLIKHRRRHRPDTLSPEEYAASYRVSPLITLHRRVSAPFTAIRRACLKLLTGRSRSPKQDGPEFVS